MDQILEGIQWITNFFGDGDVSIWQQIQAQVVIWWMKIKIAAVQHAWGVAQAVIQQLGISSAVQSAWSSIDSTLMSYMTFFKIPDAINVLISARVTRLVMSFLKIV